MVRQLYYELTRVALPCPIITRICRPIVKCLLSLEDPDNQNIQLLGQSKLTILTTSFLSSHLLVRTTLWLAALFPPQPQPIRFFIQNHSHSSVL